MDTILAIDYGERRVGVAVSGGVLARPLEVLAHGRLDSLVNRLLELARREQATRLIIGFPLNEDGSIGPQAEKTLAFARRLAAVASCPVFLWDERRSSQTAQRAMIATGSRRKARKEQLDAYAAAAILQDYLDQGGAGAVLVAPPTPEAGE